MLIEIAKFFGVWGRGLSGVVPAFFLDKTVHFCSQGLISITSKLYMIVGMPEESSRLKGLFLGQYPKSLCPRGDRETRLTQPFNDPASNIGAMPAVRVSDVVK